MKQKWVGLIVEGGERKRFKIMKIKKVSVFQNGRTRKQKTIQDGDTFSQLTWNSTSPIAAEHNTNSPTEVHGEKISKLRLAENHLSYWRYSKRLHKYKIDELKFALFQCKRISYAMSYNKIDWTS